MLEKEGVMCKFLNAVHSSRVLDLNDVGRRSGLGDQAARVYEAYVVSKGLVAKASLNDLKMGLSNSLVLLHARPARFSEAQDAVNYLFRRALAVTVQRAAGQTAFIVRAAVPIGQEENARKVYDFLEEAGLISGYELWELRSVPTHFSPDPCAFDYSSGTWKAHPSEDCEMEKNLVQQDLLPAVPDELDVVIASALKRSAGAEIGAIARTAGVSSEEIAAHLQQHVLGIGMVTSLYVDFYDPSLFAPDTATITLIAWPSSSSEEVREVLRIHYVFEVWPGVPMVAVFKCPLSAAFSVVRELENRLFGGGFADFRVFISPWYMVSSLGLPSSPTTLGSNFKGGRWRFDADEIIDGLKR